MTELTDSQKAEYFRRSYTAVDGLWFLKVEEEYGFVAALQMDEAVWRVLPKIQARTIKSMMNLQKGLSGLQSAVTTRLNLEGFTFSLENYGDHFLVIVQKCPWHDLMVKSGREKLSSKVGDLICRVENSVWSAEFSEADCMKIRFQRKEMICEGANRCVLCFSRD